MKIKSIVLTAALATAFSAFSASVDVDWFTTNVTSVVKYFDRNINDPVVVTNSVAAPAGFTVAAYAVTAYVTNLVVFAEKPAATNLTAGAKGAICAAYDSESSANKWYGLYNNDSSKADWAKLANLTDPAENSSYALRMEFKNDSGAKVRYSVDGTNGLTENDGWLASTGLYEKPDFYAFAGMGGCTNIVGEIVVTADGKDAVAVSGGKVLLPAGTTAGTAVAKQSNGLEMWVNHVLGIDGANADAKPYAAPVQNASDAELTFSLGGVNVGANVTGAKVTYTVETLSSVNPVTEDNEATEPDPVDSNSSISVNVPDGVRYYRIKIKIDPAH